MYIVLMANHLSQDLKEKINITDYMSKQKSNIFLINRSHHSQSQENPNKKLPLGTFIMHQTGTWIASYVQIQSKPQFRPDDSQIEPQIT